MATILALIRRGFRRWLGQPTHEMNLQAASLLSSQPCEILFLILEYLPPESSIAVTLTCKLLFHSFFPIMKSRLDTQSLQNLLLLLEESVSQDLYFCHDCIRLHRFLSSWAPSKDPLKPPCKPSTVDFGGREIGFYHVRLVINAHLFGPGHGLRLKQLETRILPYFHGWQTDSRARILQDQLFLQISHRLRLKQTPELIRIAVKSTYDHYVCPHITTHLTRRDPRHLTATLPTQIPQLAPLASRFSYEECSLDNCTDVPGSCSICLTDYTTSIERQRIDACDSERQLLDITIVSYHQLGCCRSPLDWKWQTFSTARPYYPTDIITRTQHPESCYEPGAVRKRWEIADSTSRQGSFWY
ncbi:hypothetical protein GQ53DRAFT_108026 [Thozetella sp. PMI_491]|nr:hypothetical protein GQ53DRAFT_108026 [Thozetella sp. PMI_491]